MLNGLLMTLLLLTAVFLILLVLIQRGRGGGLAGAFGGLGGQSAFGTKAGDLFTRITIGVAAFWIILCALSVKLLNESSPLAPNLGQNVTTGPSGSRGAEEVPGAAGGAKAAATKTDETKPAAKTERGAAKAAPAEAAPASTAPAAAPEASAPAADTKTEPAK